MEVYTLDPLLRRSELFEDHESLIWTERYKQYGDFELQIATSLRARSLLKPGTYLAMNKSRRVMKIETVEEKNVDRKRIMTIKGRSLEAIMMDRVAKESVSDLTTSPTWNITGLTPMGIARKIFHDICVTGVLSSKDVIPYIFEGSFAEPSNIPEPTDIINAAIPPLSVYDALIQLTDVWDFGFRILRQGDMSKLWFDVYTGADRTTSQTILPAVIFSPDLDNLHNVSELTTIQGAKNVAYVYSPAGFQMVYADDVDPDIDGFDRKVLIVTADDITADSTSDILAALIQRGKEELAKNRTLQAFDGEISQTSQYFPGRDYNVGDLVEQRNSDGVTNQMRVSEIIYVSDAEGERSYPTLSINKYINAGSWLAWMNNKMWSELGSEEWADQP